jgi:hypothetical protein
MGPRTGRGRFEEDEHRLLLQGVQSSASAAQRVTWPLLCLSWKR